MRSKGAALIELERWLCQSSFKLSPGRASSCSVPGSAVQPRGEWLFRGHRGVRFGIDYPDLSVYSSPLRRMSVPRMIESLSWLLL
ncbi:hypothetical protein VTH82DRAFT_1840 [Thermothelomyces myriococcoides]